MKNRKKDLTTGEIARYCQVTHFTVTNWINAGKLRAYRTPGGHHRVRQEDFVEFLATYHMPVPEELTIQTPPRILVVDDDCAVVDVLTQALRQAGYQVDSASDGYEAGLKMALFKPDLLVLDLIMPRLSGFDLCARVKRDPITEGVKIITITGYVEEGSVEKALAAGADLCLEKPFRPDHLLKEIYRLLYRSNKGYEESKGLERRKARRANLALPVRYALSLPSRNRQEQVMGKGKTANIGRGGLMLETALPLIPSNLLEVEINLHRRNQSILAEGEIRWVKQGQESSQQVGVHFTQISEKAREQLVEELFVTEQIV